MFARLFQTTPKQNLARTAVTALVILAMCSNTVKHKLRHSSLFLSLARATGWIKNKQNVELAEFPSEKRKGPATS